MQWVEESSLVHPVLVPVQSWTGFLVLRDGNGRFQRARPEKERHAGLTKEKAVRLEVRLLDAIFLQYHLEECLNRKGKQYREQRQGHDKCYAGWRRGEGACATISWRRIFRPNTNRWTWSDHVNSIIISHKAHQGQDQGYSYMNPNRNPQLTISSQTYMSYHSKILGAWKSRCPLLINCSLIYSGGELVVPRGATGKASRAKAPRVKLVIKPICKCK